MRAMDLDCSFLHSESYLIAVEGPIGAGKTSLTKKLGDACQCTTILEEVEGNPWLEGFHNEATNAAFHAQIYFLQSRLRQQNSISELKAKKESIVSDYNFHDREKVFTDVFLSELERATYWKLRGAIANEMVAPDLVIHLTADTETLYQRVQQRGRQQERQTDMEFVELMREEYVKYYSASKPRRFLELDTARIDFVHSESDLSQILDWIKQRLV